MDAAKRLIDSICEAMRPSDDDPPWRWAEKNISVDKTSPFPGRWRSDNSPWVRELMECFADDRINDISVMCAAQSGKTQTIMCLLAWAIDQEPGPAMWVMAAQDEAKTFAKTRLMPTLEQCEPILNKIPKNRHEKTILEINFDSMPLIINGANSQSKLQSKPIRWLFLDEVRNYPPGALEMVLKRTRAFWNARRLIISTPDTEGDAVHRAFLAGDQRHIFIQCTSCKELQELKWRVKREDGTFSGMKWDDNEVTHPTEGQWDFDKLALTIRYECHHCRHEIKDTNLERKAICASAKWQAQNPLAPKNKVSFTWNALLPHWVMWRDLVEEFLNAKEASKVAAMEPLKTFINESLGEPWQERPEDEMDFKLGTYQKLQEWLDAAIIFMGVDVQKDHFWFVCRAIAKDGRSRLIDEGKLTTYEDVREKQLQHKILDRAVGIDSGYDTMTVYRNCVNYGWTALKGEDRDFYTHHVGGKSIRRIFSSLQKADPAIGTAGQRTSGKANLFLWSNPKVKDLLSWLSRGHGQEFGLPSDVSPEYKEHRKNEVKRRRHNKQGRPVLVWEQMGKKPNHMNDCECEIIVLAAIAGLISSSALEKEEVKKQEELPEPE